MPRNHLISLAFLVLFATYGCGSDAPGASDAGDASQADTAVVDVVDSDTADSGRADAGPEDAGPPVDPAKAAQVCAALDTFLEETGISGGTVAVRFANGATHACYSGTANTSMSLPVAPGHRFRIGSVTKTFVGALMLLLAEDGLLSLDDPLSDWVDGFEGDPTIAQLLNHTSGLGDFVFDDVFRSDVRSHTEEELLSVARTQPRVFATGAHFGYSNTNYLLLSVIATAAGGAHWSEQARTRLFEPLGLSNTFVDGYEETPESPVRGYERAGTEYLDVTDTFHQSMASGAGCMVSDARDLLRWSAGLYGGELLSETSMRALTVENRVPYQDDRGVAEGLQVGLANFIETGDSEFGEVYGHSGGTPGFSTNLRYLARDGTAQVSILNTQATSEESRQLTQALWVALLVD